MTQIVLQLDHLVILAIVILKYHLIEDGAWKEAMDVSWMNNSSAGVAYLTSALQGQWLFIYLIYASFFCPMGTLTGLEPSSFYPHNNNVKLREFDWPKTTQQASMRDGNLNLGLSDSSAIVLVMLVCNAGRVGMREK